MKSHAKLNGTLKIANVFMVNNFCVDTASLDIALNLMVSV